MMTNIRQHCDAARAERDYTKGAAISLDTLVLVVYGRWSVCIL
jgi:hypothetical protein